MALLLACYVAAFSAGYWEPPPQFWWALANCPTVAAATRRDCVLQLLRRHLRTGMRLSELARLLDNPSWLRDEDVDICGWVIGFIPVSFTFDDTIFVLRVLPRELNSEMAGVYLRVAGNVVTREDLVRLLRGVPAGTIKGATILEIGYSDPRILRPAARPPRP